MWLSVHKSQIKPADCAECLSRKLIRSGYFLGARVKPNDLKQTEMEYQERQKLTESEGGREDYTALSASRPIKPSWRRYKICRGLN